MWACGWVRARGASRLVVVGVRAESPLTDADDHELGRPQRRDADKDDEPAVVDLLLRHRALVTPDEERVLRFGPDEATVAPQRGQELLDLLADAGPEPLVIGL